MRRFGREIADFQLVSVPEPATVYLVLAGILSSYGRASQVHAVVSVRPRWTAHEGIPCAGIARRISKPPRLCDLRTV